MDNIELTGFQSDPHVSDDSTEFDSLGDVHSVQPGKPKLFRAKSIRQSIAKNTMDFFGVAPECEEEAVQEKWNQRRLRLRSRLGKVKGSASVPMTPDMTDGAHMSNIVQLAMSQHRIGTYKTRRQNAAKLLWRTASKRLSAKPQYDLSTVQSYGGRSFAPADLVDDEISVFSSASHLNDERQITPSSGLPTPSLIDDHAFFFFDHPSVIEEEEFDGDGFDEVDLKRDARPTTPSSPTPQIVSSWDNRFGLETVAKPKFQTMMGERRGRSGKQATLKKPKREFGKGLVGNLLNRTLHRSRLTSKVQAQIDEFCDHRPYFTYWLSFVQVIIMILMISIYPFAPVGISQKEITEEVLLSRNGVLQLEYRRKMVVESFWIGPSLETLILLGAKYAPCMRHDLRLYRKLREEREMENNTGCCMQTYNTGCIQRPQRECSSSFTTFTPKSVCGQDPAACLNPASKFPNEWNKYTITKWPVCRQTVNISTLNRETFPHMRCEITGRPCCIGTQAQCIITSQKYCQFENGIYHPDKTLCSQVDCFSSTCGLLPFVNDDQPDQFYRLWLSLFLNAGLMHLVLVLAFNFTIMRDIEKMAGWLRTALIFLVSGIGGSLWSSILLPYSPEVGPSGSCFGIIACLFVELIQSWQLIARPWRALAKLCCIVFVLFILGLLPYIDNYAHIFGFVYGFFSAMIFLPYVTFGKWDRRRKQIQIVLAVGCLLLITIVGFVLFYEVQEFHSSVITYFNCLPVTENFCQNFHRGQALENRKTGY